VDSIAVMNCQARLEDAEIIRGEVSESQFRDPESDSDQAPDVEQDKRPRREDTHQGSRPLKRGVKRIRRQGHGTAKRDRGKGKA